MNAIALTISNIPVRQDDKGRYSLNDLHKAAGAESKHQPANWLRLDSTQELVTELDQSSEMRSVEVIKGGKAPGTFVVKELVYAYAMWISAKFHIAVIRAYDAMVTGSTTIPSAPERKTKKALPGCLTPEQQDNIKALVKARGERVPDDKAASVIIKTWSSIKSKFGCTYKEIPQEEYLNVISLIERLPIEGELMPKQDQHTIPTKSDQDYQHAREYVEQLKQSGRVAVDDALFNEFQESLTKLEKCLVSAWTEMDEAIFRMSHAMTFLKRWRTKA